ncbi:MAG: competence/damage-inducible protein A [Candidatus Eremiobacteraeota bacterium]|nr:competence/damage-inducible protein A [Candidatus Eremiobacteraeota bacterium]
MPSVELIAVGTELLLGQLVDTNTALVASQLALSGIDVHATHGIGDNRARIARAIGSTLDRADGAITTGGLGPTVDDVTKEAVCDLLDVDTELHGATYDTMAAFFTAMGRTMRENNRKQAEIPRGSYALANRTGTAAGFVAFRADGKFVACMPGVPREMKPMLVEELIPFLRERFGVRSTIVTRVLHTVDIAESEIDHRIEDLFRAGENPKIAVLAHEGLCDIKVMAKAQTAEQADALIAPPAAEIRTRLRGHVFGEDGESLASSIHGLLQARGEVLGVAESCTGGRIAAALTAVAGSSASFRGGIVAYDNAVKISELDVPDSTLRRFGAVSEETARAMAEGVKKRLGTDYALATTGVAGPGGGSDEKPVGLVWIAIAGDGGGSAHRVVFPGDREAVQRRATLAALAQLWRTLSRHVPN